MTLNGTVSKTLLLMGFVLAGAAVGAHYPHSGLVARDLTPVTPWRLYMAFAVPFFWPGLFASLLALIGFVAWFFERAQPYLATAFAFVQGMCMASLAAATNARYPGVAAMAALATCALLAVLLGMYHCGAVIDASPLKVGAVAAFVTLVCGGAVILLMQMFGQEGAAPRQTMIVYWAITCGFMVYLSQELAQSFRYIDEGIEMGAPKRMEWRAAFGLMVALVFIYVTVLDVLRQVARTRSSRR
jgi:uncharacterized YccA/Bax inhibitor family protein